MARADQRQHLAKWAISAIAAGGALLATCPAAAQQQTFHLDRLEVPGAPDDGLVLFRPVTQKPATFYAQFGLGLAIDPLRTGDITDDGYTKRHSATNVITSQLSTYVSAGFELLDHLILGATFPSAWVETGNQPRYPGGSAQPLTLSKCAHS